MRLTLLSILLALPMLSFAKSHGPAGCGLGTMLFSGKKGLVFNVLAATTNGTSGNQTFGMSTGTLGCQVSDKTKVAAINFIEANKVALARDAAYGKGESIAAIAEIYQCSNNEKFGAAIQGHYSEIFRSTNAARINRGMVEALVLEKACS
jgi:hypothetical protein